MVESVEIGELPAELLERHLLTRCFVHPGDRLSPITNGNEMRAVVVAVAASRREAVAAADALAANLTICTTALAGGDAP